MENQKKIISVSERSHELIRNYIIDFEYQNRIRLSIADVVDVIMESIDKDTLKLGLNEIAESRRCKQNA